MKIKILAFVCFSFFFINQSFAQADRDFDASPLVYDGKSFVKNENLDVEDHCLYSMDFLKSYYKELKYPASARDKGVSGTVILSVIVNEMGQHTDPALVRDIGEGCGDAALQAFKKSLNLCDDDIMLDGKAVRAKLFVPVSFRIH